jgi:hypothetical protein
MAGTFPFLRTAAVRSAYAWISTSGPNNFEGRFRSLASQGERYVSPITERGDPGAVKSIRIHRKGPSATVGESLAVFHHKVHVQKLVRHCRVREVLVRLGGFPLPGIPALKASIITGFRGSQRQPFPRIL